MRVVLACLLVLALWPPARATAEEPTAEDFRPLFDALQKAVVEGERSTIARLFKVQLTIETLAASGFLDDLPEALRLKIEGGLTLGLPIALSTRDVIEPFESYEIRRVRAGEASGRYRVYVRLRAEDGTLTKMLWSVAKTDDGYRIYDFEDLELGLTFAQLIGTGTAAALDGGEAFRSAAVAILGAHELMLAGDNQGALAKLQAVASEDLPASFRGLRHMLIGALQIDAGEAEKALANLSKAQALDEDALILVYLEAVAHNNLAQHEQAFARANAYIDALDGDPAIWVEVARAHAGLLRLDQALLVLEKALEEDPRYTDALAWYATFLPPDQKPKAVTRILALPELERDIELIFEHLLDRDEGASMRVVAEAYMAKRPAHPDGPYYLGHALKLLEDTSEKPVEAFRKAMQLGAEHKHAQVYREAWCDIMLERDRALEGYAKSIGKVSAFDYLAWDLAWGERGETLRQLAALAAKDLGADDAGVIFFAAEADQVEAKYEAVIERLDGARSGLRAKEDALDERSKDLMWQVEDRLVRAYVRLERFEEGLEVARAIYVKDADPRYLAIVYAVKGDTDKALQALTECLTSGDYLPEDLFEDEDMAAALEGEAYRALREKHYRPR